MTFFSRRFWIKFYIFLGAISPAQLQASLQSSLQTSLQNAHLHQLHQLQASMLRQHQAQAASSPFLSPHSSATLLHPSTLHAAQPGKFTLQIFSAALHSHLHIFHYLIFFSILGYFPIFGSSGSPFAPVPSKEGSYSSTKVPTPPSLPPVHHHHLDSSSNVVSSTMEDDDKSNIKVTSFRIL